MRQPRPFQHEYVQAQRLKVSDVFIDEGEKIELRRLLLKFGLEFAPIEARYEKRVELMAEPGA